MKRCSKGIFGIKKDPKNQILFSFSAREGEEWPSDDSDSDFLPSEDEDTKPIRKKRQNKSDDNQKKGPSTKSNDVVPKKGVVCASLPEEIWKYIFQIVIKESGPLPFLCRAAKVCKLWQGLASHPSLWRKVDLSFGWIRPKKDTLKWLVRERLSQCREINMTNWTLTNDQLKMVLQNCSELKCLNLSYCKKLSQEGFAALVDNGEHLEKLDVSFTAINANNIKDIVMKHCKSIKELHIGGNSYLNFPALANRIYENCSGLEVLDVSNCRFSGDYVSIDVQKFQTHCPLLRVLRLGNSKFRLKKTNGSLPGFEKLQELSLGCLDSNKSGGINTAFVYDILIKSSELKLLDLGGCWNMEDMTPLLGLPFTDLEQLYLSSSPIRLNNLLGPLLQKCKHTLRILHIDKNIFLGDDLDTALQELFPLNSTSVLEVVNAAETNISESSVERLLRNCRNLHYINLSSCRALPRGIKREYKDKEIAKLKSFFGIK
ncbi:F-box/LRR-repeat protein 6-like isoform X2 [Crassostrea virginica]